MIALLALEGEDTDCLVGEAVLMDGEPVGSVTSAGYGHTIGKSLAVAFLKEACACARHPLEGVTTW